MISTIDLRPRTPIVLLVAASFSLASVILAPLAYAHDQGEVSHRAAIGLQFSKMAEPHVKFGPCADRREPIRSSPEMLLVPHGDMDLGLCVDVNVLGQVGGSYAVANLGTPDKEIVRPTAPRVSEPARSPAPTPPDRTPTAVPTATSAPIPQPSAAPTPGSEMTITLPGGVPLGFVRVPAGSFAMGSADTERSRDSDEGPVHTVDIAYDFYMGRCELTQRQWLALMGSWPETAPSSTYGLGDNYPAYNVSWKDCQNYIAALNAHVSKTGQGPATFRLPSESEWEYACRAGTQTRFFFGDSLSADDRDTDGPAGTLPGNRSDYMWFRFNCQGNANGAQGTKPVGTKLPNRFGLYDMSGNVWEWCQDWYHSKYAGAPMNGSAWESPVGLYRVVRGGHWHYYADDCRSAARPAATPDTRYNALGVRLVRAQ